MVTQYRRRQLAKKARKKAIDGWCTTALILFWLGMPVLGWYMLLAVI